MSVTISISEFVENQVEVNRRLWYAADDHLPGFEQGYTAETKKANQRHLHGQLDWLSANLDRPFADEGSRNRFMETAGQHFKMLGKEVLGLTPEQMSVFEKEGLIRLSQEFFETARKFAPKMSTEDIFQASRNVWTACYLQILLGLEAKLTPAIFAYSMLYPVTDNYLDDPKRSYQEKITFNRHFCAWLRGEPSKPAGEHEEMVLRLIRLIESQYDREQFPQVYESLLAIFCAQQDSLLMPSYPVTPYAVDVLGITLAKGGTSVLADGVLAAGSLTLEQMQTIFNYGCFAQFMDDQEDVAADLRTNSLTVFSEAARAGKLDTTLNRLFDYSRTILQGLNNFVTERSRPLIEVSLKGIDLLLIDACVRTRAYYCRNYLAYLEAFFPVSYACLNDLRKQLRRRNLSVERLAGAFLKEPTESPTALIGSPVPHAL